MAEGDQQIPVQEEEEDDDKKPEYKPPAEKSIEEILTADQEDEALNKYKATLLGQAGAGKNPVVLYPDNPKNVILSKMSLVVEGRQNKEIDLTNVNNLKSIKFIVKEGAKYQLQISFQVQREIVSGLRFHNKITRNFAKFKAVKIDQMVGSYAPSEKMIESKTAQEEFPSGMLFRGNYDVHSCFVDDDKNEILAWDWKLEIKKDWED